MERLVAKIKEQFSKEAIIEIYVLDESGSPIELYSGLPQALTSNCLEQVFIFISYSFIIYLYFYLLFLFFF